MSAPFLAFYGEYALSEGIQQTIEVDWFRKIGLASCDLGYELGVRGPQERSIDTS